MITVQFYECEFCHDKFEVQEECRKCEASHQETSDIKRDKCIYQYGHPYPSAIQITFDDGQTQTYILKPSPSTNMQISTSKNPPDNISQQTSIYMAQ